MRITPILIIVTILTTFAMAGSAFADFYVVQDKLGQAAVVEGEPGLGWLTVGGPYATKDEAQRAIGAAAAVNPTASPRQGARYSVQARSSGFILKRRI